MRQMSRLNWRRALLGGVLAAVLWGVLYAPVHPLVEVHTTLGRPVLPITPFRGAALLLRVLVVLTGFVQGIATVCLYAAIRPRFGAGPSTAAIAALSVWFLTSWMHSGVGCVHGCPNRRRAGAPCGQSAAGGARGAGGSMAL